MHGADQNCDQFLPVEGHETSDDLYSRWGGKAHDTIIAARFRVDPAELGPTVQHTDETRFFGASFAIFFEAF